MYKYIIDLGQLSILYKVYTRWFHLNLEPENDLRKQDQSLEFVEEKAMSKNEMNTAMVDNDSLVLVEQKSDAIFSG